MKVGDVVDWETLRKSSIVLSDSTVKTAHAVTRNGECEYWIDLTDNIIIKILEVKKV